MFNSPMAVKILDPATQKEVTVLIPCHNEATTIGPLLGIFKKIIPYAEIVVIDNASTDQTAAIAAASGAVVLFEPKLGKGFAVNAGVNHSVNRYILLIDGDQTYDALDSLRIIEELQSGADMVVATRMHADPSAYRKGHQLGNFIFTMLQKKLLGVQVKDTLSGFRGFNQAFLRTFTADAKGFEIETHLNIHSAVIKAKVTNFESNYVERPTDSKSKLNTYRDGFRILKSVIRLLVKWRPLVIFGLIGSIALSISIVFLLIPISEFINSGFILHIPTLIASSTLSLFSFSMIFFGFMANEIVNMRIETSRRDFTILKLFTNKSL